MSKYQSWILNKRELAPLSNTAITLDINGNVRRHIYNTYECPYCHTTVTCTLTNKLDFRKCRYCHHPVSPYKGDITDIIYLPEGVENIP